MRCLHCGKRLTMLRKLSDAEFCSEAHRAAFGQEQEQLALSRLIDAQQQSHHRKPEKGKPLAAPAVDLSDLSPGGTMLLMPAPAETEWRGYRKESMEPLFETAEIISPRLETPPLACSVRAGESVWPDVRVLALTGDLPAGTNEIQEWIPPAQSVSLLEANGLGVMGPLAAEPTEPVLIAEEPVAAVELTAEKPVELVEQAAPQPGLVVWSAAVGARNGILAPRPGDIVSAPFRRSREPEALPRAALIVVADNASFLPVRPSDVRSDGKTLFRLTPPKVRTGRRPGGAIGGSADWVAPVNFPPGNRLRGANLRPIGLVPLRIEKLTAGSYLRADIREDAVLLLLACTLPSQGIPRDYAGLRHARRLELTVPLAAWGNNLQNVYPEPESIPAFVAAPRSQGPRLKQFNPPMYGIREIRLSIRSERSPSRWIGRKILGPAPSVVALAAYPRFVARVVCDWVPVQADMMPLACKVSLRNGPCGTPQGAPEGAQPETLLTAATSVPLLRLQAASQPGVKGAANRMRKISLDSTAPQQAATAPKALLQPSPIETAKILPRAKLRVTRDQPTLAIERRLNAPGWNKALYRAGELWAAIPPMGRIAGVLMTLLLIVFFAAPGARQAAASNNLQASLAGGWETVQHNIWKRAAVALTDDFRAGLADWEGEGDWARQWSYDQSGFVRTGPMALYSPSLQLTDYSMEFLGQIEKRSLGWVVRAADNKNYYALRLAISDPGPVPEVVFQRWAVIDGKPEAVKTKRLPMQVRLDTLYRVQMELRGNDFALSVQGSMVDSWSEPRLPRGGIGFFSGRGELSRLRWVGVWHQYDTLGRLCALLAPQSLADRERGVSQ